MEGLLRALDQLLFAVLPYVAVVAFSALAVARGLGLPPFGAPAAPAPLPVGRQYAVARALFGYGLLVVLGGHLLGFLVPEQVLLWNSDPTRRHALEGGVFVVGLVTVAGLVVLLAHPLGRPEARQGIGFAGWFVYILLLFQLVVGLCVALFYPWGSSLYATAAVPYLRSLVELRPDVGYVSGLPVLVKLHMASAFLLLGLLPFAPVVRPLVERGELGRPRVGNRMTTAVLLVGLGLSLLALGVRLQTAPLFGNQKGYQPIQPIAFSHRQHAGELQIACAYCHHEAEKGPRAGLPAASVCMNCHHSVKGPAAEVRAEAERAKREKRPPSAFVSPELTKLYEALGLNDKLQKDGARHPTPLRWVKVHNLPAFTRFDHRAHVSAGVSCQHCHGRVETMERVRQVESLSMGWCVQCHREANQNGVAGKPVHASNDCSTCHH